MSRKKSLDIIECLNRNVLTDFTSNECETNQKSSRSFFLILWIFVTSTICLLLVFYVYTVFIFIKCIISYQMFASVYFKLYKTQKLLVKMICVLLNNDLCILNSVQWQRMSTNSRYSLVLCTFHLNLIAQKVQILLLGKYHKIKKTSPECIAETFIAFSTSYV